MVYVHLGVGRFKKPVLALFDFYSFLNLNLINAAAAKGVRASSRVSLQLRRPAAAADGRPLQNPRKGEFAGKMEEIG